MTTLRTLKATLGSTALAVAVAGAPALAQDRFANVEITAVDLGDGLFILEGAGGHIGLSIGPDGVFLVDSQFEALSEKITDTVGDLIQDMADAAEGDVTAVSGERRFVLNTHYHGDHSGGNPSWRTDGAEIIGQDNVRARMSTETISTFSGRPQPPAPQEAWPTITFKSEATLYLNGETVRLVHLPNAHTDGDSIVIFEEPNVIHTGDLFFNGVFPYIDTNNGGTAAGYLAAQDAILALADEDTTLIAGHGPSRATIADLRQSRDVLALAIERVGAAIAEGKSLEDTIAADLMADYESWGTFFISGDALVETLYADLGGVVEEAEATGQ